MSISSINYGSSVLGQSVRNINKELTDLSTQLDRQVSQNYAGMGTNEGLAIAARSQIPNIAAYTDTISRITTNISIANTAFSRCRRSATVRTLPTVRRDAQQRRADHFADDRGGPVLVLAS
jgi:hypothetical protein